MMIFKNYLKNDVQMHDYSNFRLFENISLKLFSIVCATIGHDVNSHHLKLIECSIKSVLTFLTVSRCLKAYRSASAHSRLHKEQ
jgi:hypothetical protein